MDHADRIRVDTREGVADVHLARPDKLNALDPAMLVAIKETGNSLARDRSVRAVVLSGDGRGFCAGLDFTSFAAMASRSDGSGEAGSMLGRDPDSPANLAQEAGWVWHEMPVPVIAAVHGVCFGGGLQIALGADIRIVHPEARMSVMEIKWGLVPDMSGTQTLRHLVRLDVAKELTFTGREISGQEAHTLGLATRVHADPHAEAMAMARAIAQRSPDAIRAGKALWNRAVELDAAEGLRFEERAQRGLIGKPNNAEAIAANLEKRPPRFQDPQ